MCNFVSAFDNLTESFPADEPYGYWPEPGTAFPWYVCHSSRVDVVGNTVLEDGYAQCTGRQTCSK